MRSFQKIAAAATLALIALLPQIASAQNEVTRSVSLPKVDNRFVPRSNRVRNMRAISCADAIADSASRPEIKLAPMTNFKPTFSGKKERPKDGNGLPISASSLRFIDRGLSFARTPESRRQAQSFQDMSTYFPGFTDALGQTVKSNNAYQRAFSWADFLNTNSASSPLAPLLVVDQTSISNNAKEGERQNQIAAFNRRREALNKTDLRGVNPEIRPLLSATVNGALPYSVAANLMPLSPARGDRATFNIPDYFKLPMNQRDQVQRSEIAKAFDGLGIGEKNTSLEDPSAASPNAQLFSWASLAARDGQPLFISSSSAIVPDLERLSQSTAPSNIKVSNGGSYTNSVGIVKIFKIETTSPITSTFYVIANF